MSGGRDGNGRFTSGNRANPNGRPRKTRTLSEDIARELSAKVTITENGKRKRVSKLSASAKQIANQAASGDLKAAKLTMDLAQKADRDREAAPIAAGLTATDKEIVMRFITRFKATEPFEESGDDAA
jgi:hypothetical protein